MRLVLILFLRIALALGLAFVPVANAFNMAAMMQGTEDEDQAPPCHMSNHMPNHMPDHTQQSPDDKCCHGGGGHCHCAMATCLPTAGAGVARASLPSDHPQTAHSLALGFSTVPEPPPPRSLS